MFKLRHLFILSLFSVCAFAQADSHFQVPELPAFTAVKSDGRFDVDIKVGRAQSVTFEGKEDDFKKIIVKVVNGELQIKESPEGSVFSSLDKKFRINLPTLRSYKGKGIGSVDIEDIKGDAIEISYEGAGKLEASGHVKSLRLNAKGIGKLDMEDLQAENVDVDFQGVGDAEIFVSKNLNANVKGIGSLTYFGHPTSVKTSGEGVGNISAGH